MAWRSVDIHRIGQNARRRAEKAAAAEINSVTAAPLIAWRKRRRGNKT